VLTLKFCCQLVKLLLEFAVNFCQLGYQAVSEGILGHTEFLFDKGAKGLFHRYLLQDQAFDEDPSTVYEILPLERLSQEVNR
jgi:hypothetical protein